VREESPNGGAKQRLAGDEWAAVAYLGDGENGEKEKDSAGVSLFIVGGERERKWSWSRTSASDCRRLAGLVGIRRSTAPLSHSDLRIARSF
jgi:hypothetical protein